MRIKIPKKFILTSGELFNYLKTVKKFGKLEEEILATLTYKKAYKTIKGKDYLISFPYQESKQIEIERRPVLAANQIGRFIKKYSDQNSAIDSYLVDPVSKRSSLVRPLQIKFLGKGKKSSRVNNRRFINFLKKYKNYDGEGISLVVVLEGSFKIDLEGLSKWLKVNKYPFPKVVLINSDNKTGKMGYYQLKPSKERPSSIVFTREEMYKEMPE